MVQLAAAVVVEGEDPISWRAEVVAADPPTHRILLSKNRREGSILEDPDDAGARPIQHQVIQLAAAVVVEGEDPIGRCTEVVATDTIARDTLSKDRPELRIN